MASADRFPRIWSPMATQDLLDIWSYVCAATSADTADEQLQEIERVCLAVRDWPEFGKARDDVREGLRSVRTGRYVIFYRFTKKRIEIVRVLDERRDVDAIFSDGE